MVSRRDRVKEKSNIRHNQLVDSNQYQVFNRDADEVRILGECSMSILEESSLGQLNVMFKL